MFERELKMEPSQENSFFDQNPGTSSNAEISDAETVDHEDRFSYLTRPSLSTQTMDSNYIYTLQVTEIKKLQQCLSKEKDKNQSLQTKNKELIMHNNQAESKLHAYQKELNKKESEITGIITSLNQKMKEFNATKERLEQENKNLKASTLSLEREKKDLEKRCTKLSETNQSLETEKETFQTEIAKLNNSYLKLKSEKSDLEKSYAESKSWETTIKDTCTKLIKHTENLVKTCQDTESEKAELEKKNNDLEKSNEKLSQELKDLKTSYESMKMQNQQFRYLDETNNYLIHIYYELLEKFKELEVVVNYHTEKPSNKYDHYLKLIKCYKKKSNNCETPKKMESAQKRNIDKVSASPFSKKVPVTTECERKKQKVEEENASKRIENNKDSLRGDEPSTSKEVPNSSSNSEENRDENMENISTSVTPHSEEEDLEDNEIYEEEQDNNRSFMMRCTKTCKGSVDIGEGIFVQKMLLIDAKQKAKSQKNLAILLVKAICKPNFLRQCSITGRGQQGVKYQLPEKVLRVVIDYSSDYAKSQNWRTFDEKDIIRGIGYTLSVWRRPK